MKKVFLSLMLVAFAVSVQAGEGKDCAKSSACAAEKKVSAEAKACPASAKQAKAQGCCPAAGAKQTVAKVESPKAETAKR